MLTESSDEVAETAERATDLPDFGSRPTGRPRGLALRGVPGAVLMFVTLAALVGVGLMARSGLEDRHSQARKTDAVAAAKSLVLAVTSVESGDIARGIDAVLAQSTGEFKEQFAAQKAAYLDAVGKAKVSSAGRIDQAGVVSSADGKVVVLIAASATITNPKATEGDRRVYRMRVTEVFRGGTWLTEKLELVA